jgi:cystathionine beta-lyase
LEEKGLIAFAGAEMDFKTAPVIVEAVTEFASRGIYGFTLPDKQFIKAIQWWMKNVRELDVDREEIIPTLGTIFSVGTTVKAFTNEGDGVILMPPIYYRYKPRIVTNGRIPVYAPLKEKNGVYSIDFKLLELKMAEPQNKLLVLCNPHNPTGKVFEKDELQKIKTLAHKYNVLVFSDEIFGALGFDGRQAIPYVKIDPENGITCTSLGKVFNLTGINHANLIIKNKKIREAFKSQKTVDHFGSIDPFFYSALIAGYSKKGLSWVREMKNYVWQNYVYIKQFLKNNLPDICISPLEGGFTVWLDFRKMKLDEKELKSFLEDEALMIIDHGEEYGEEGIGFGRMNIASPRLFIEKGLNNLKNAYDKRDIKR